MKRDTTEEPAGVAEGTLFFAEDWFDPLDAGMRISRARRTFARIRRFEKSWRTAGLDEILAVA